MIIPTRPSDNFAFFPLSEATLERFCMLWGGSGPSWALFLDPRRLLGAPRASPGAPLGRSRGAPGTLRDAPGTTLKRPGRPEVDFESILGAPGASRERFLVDFGFDSGGFFGLLRRANRKRFRPDVCDWWTNCKGRLTVRLARRLTRQTA